MDDEQLRSTLQSVTSLVGTPHEKLDCFGLIAHAFSLRGVKLLPNYLDNAIGAHRSFDTAFAGDYDAMMARSFIPKPWDVLVIRNHRIFPNHLALVIDIYSRFITSVEDVGVHLGQLQSSVYAKPRRLSGVVRLRVDLL